MQKSNLYILFLAHGVCGVFARRLSFSLSLCVSVFYCVYRVCSVVCLISFLECGLHCSNNNSFGRSDPCVVYNICQTTESTLCFKFYVRVPVCLSAVYNTYDMYMIYTYMYLVCDFAVLFHSFVRSLVHWKCVNVITSLLLFETQTTGSEVKHIRIYDFY